MAQLSSTRAAFRSDETQIIRSAQTNLVADHCGDGSLQQREDTFHANKFIAGARAAASHRKWATAGRFRRRSAAREAHFGAARRSCANRLLGRRRRLACPRARALARTQWRPLIASAPVIIMQQQRRARADQSVAQSRARLARLSARLCVCRPVCCGAREPSDANRVRRSRSGKTTAAAISDVRRAATRHCCRRRRRPTRRPAGGRAHERASERAQRDATNAPNERRGHVAVSESPEARDWLQSRTRRPPETRRGRLCARADAPTRAQTPLKNRIANFKPATNCRRSRQALLPRLVGRRNNAKRPLTQKQTLGRPAADLERARSKHKRPINHFGFSPLARCRA